MKYLLVFSLALGLVACEDSAQEKLAKIQLEKKPFSDAVSKKNACIREALGKKDVPAAEKCQADFDLLMKEKGWPPKG